jgi:hypothetical protein
MMYIADVVINYTGAQHTTEKWPATVYLYYYDKPDVGAVRTEVGQWLMPISGLGVESVTIRVAIGNE